jgi:DNA-binding transcriptional ArsR family regulator
VVGLSQSALSQHLARLRRENLVKTRRQAQTIFYSLDGDAAAHLIDAIVRVYGGRPLARRAADDGARGRAACG